MPYNFSKFTDEQVVYMFEHAKGALIMVAAWEELDRRGKLDLICTAV